MASTQIILYVIIAILVLTVIGLAIPLGICAQKHDEEGLCLCRGGGVKQEVNRAEQMKRYNDGRTEFSDFGFPPQYVHDFANPSDVQTI